MEALNRGPAGATSAGASIAGVGIDPEGIDTNPAYVTVLLLGVSARFVKKE